ncbi:hypothetical protein ACLB2K_035022 [Fragaria x ananassa]
MPSALLPLRFGPIGDVEGFGLCLLLGGGNHGDPVVLVFLRLGKFLHRRRWKEEPVQLGFREWAGVGGSTGWRADGLAVLRCSYLEGAEWGTAVEVVRTVG